jgi:hypothetical protein
MAFYLITAILLIHTRSWQCHSYVSLTRNSCGNLLTIFYLIIFRVNYIQHTFKEPHATNNSRAPQLTFVQSNNIRIYIPVSEKKRVENKIVPSGHRCKTSIIAYRKSMTINKLMQDSKSYRQEHKCPKIKWRSKI